MCHSSRLIHIISATIALVFTVSCVSTPSLPDVFEACSLPCWAGITPGVTGRARAERIIENLVNAELIQIGQLVDEEQFYSVGWISTQGGEIAGGQITITDSRVRDMQLGLREGELTVDEFIEQVGHPESVQVDVDMFNWDDCLSSELLYPALGVMAELNQESNSIGVSPTQSIRTLWLYPRGSDLVHSESIVFRWSGYHDYCPTE